MLFQLYQLPLAFTELQLQHVYTSACIHPVFIFYFFYFYCQDEYIQSRASAMENIESTIVELGSIFQELAHMVKEQEEQIERFDDQPCCYTCIHNAIK